MTQQAQVNSLFPGDMRDDVAPWVSGDVDPETMGRIEIYPHEADPTGFCIYYTFPDGTLLTVDVPGDSGGRGVEIQRWGRQEGDGNAPEMEPGGVWVLFNHGYGCEPDRHPNDRNVHSRRHLRTDGGTFRSMPSLCMADPDRL